MIIMRPHMYLVYTKYVLVGKQKAFFIKEEKMLEFSFEKRN